MITRTSRTVDFYFAGTSDKTTNEYWELQATNFKYVEKKLVRLINNYKMEASVTWIKADAGHVSALLTFEYGACWTNKEDDAKIDRDLTRVINSHKEAATFGWPSITTNKKAGN